MRVEQITSVQELEKVVELEKEVWDISYRECTPSHVFVICEKIGGFVLGYYDEQDVLVGFCHTLPAFDTTKKPYHYIHSIGVKPKIRAKNLSVSIPSLSPVMASP